MKRTLTSLAIVTIITAPLPAAAEDTAELEGLLDTSVVSAPSKTAETVNLAPATSIVLTAEDLRRHGIRTLDEAINFLAFGMITERNFQTAEVGARGVLLPGDFGSHVLLMVDGHVLNEPWGGTAYFDRSTAIPFELIDHIEIVLGPGSVLYGSHAMLGIVHIVTKRAKDWNGLHVAIESEVPTTLRAGAGIGRELELFGNRGELVFAAEYYRQDGPAFDLGPQENGPDLVTGIERHLDPNPADRIYPPGVWGGKGDDAYYAEIPSAYLRLRLGEVEVGVRAALSKRTDPTSSDNFDDPRSFEIDRWLSLDVKHTLSASAAVRLSTRLYADLYDYNQYWTSNGAQDCLPEQNAGCLWRLRGAAQWIGLEPQLSLDWFEDGQVVTLLGLDGRIKQIQSRVDYIDNVTGNNPGPLGVYEPTERALAAYVQQTAWLTPWFALNAGARLDIDERFGSHGSPRAALALLPWPGATLKVMYSEAFRAPTAFDRYYYDPTTQIPGGTDLEPETVRSVEASVGQRFGTQALQLGVFRSWWDELLLVQDLSPEELQAAIDRGELEAQSSYGSQVRNVSTIRSIGFNVGYEGSLVAGRLRYGASFTEAIARREEPGLGPELLAVAPQAFGNARVSYDLGNGLPTVALAARWVGRRPPDDGVGFVKPTTEWRAALSGPIAGGFSYRFTANYLATKRGAYSVRGGVLPSGAPEHNPSDQFRVGLGLAYDLPL